MNTFGRHLLVEYFGCDPSILNDPAQLEAMMRQAADASGATIVGEVFHRFTPCGASGVLVLQESHISIHTWPEVGYAAMDFYTCGDCDPNAGHLVLCEGLAASGYEIIRVDRGRMERPRSLDILEHRSEAIDAGGAGPVVDLAVRRRS